ncbi:MAG: FAD-linked oxidase C-terminal domain-containing protein [Myxococcota bacterium]
MLQRAPFPRVDPARVDRAKRALSRALGDSRVTDDPELLEGFAGDTSDQAPVMPDVLVRAEGAEDIAKTLEIASACDVPVTPRGAGTGKSGGCVPVFGGICLSLMGMNTIDEIDRDEHLVVAGPGVVLGDLFSAVEAEGLFYPPDPNSWSTCSLGGTLAENASGPRSFKYGPTRDYVLGLDVITADGRRLRTGRRTKKGVTGYDLTSLLVGSEGTLAVTERATLRLIGRPAQIVTLLVTFDDVEDSARAVAAVAAQGITPRCLELLDEACLRSMRAQGVGVDAQARALLITEVDGDPAACDRVMEALGQVMMDHGARDVLVAQDAGQRERVWSVRRELSYTTRRMAAHKVSEDVVVPRMRMPALIREVERIGERRALRTLSYGHAGDGNLHVNILWDDPDEATRVEGALDDLFQAVMTMGGTLSGEHGIGTSKAAYLPLEQSDELIALQQDLKRVFDPKGILNPGKIFPRRHGHC